ncbi:MAG TPA: glycosyltransferase, partial [Kofleriaceae bacterium]|nr:glycosyltransferase [Kofleriaceae bacterium]
ACGLCVITTSVGGIPDMLHHERDALLVEAGDAAGMARMVDRVLAEPALAAQLSRAGHELAMASDWSLVLERWEQMFEVVCR